jgi:YesN/AraC family two-component response regulator
LGITLIDCVTGARIERAKELLLLGTGQSYFTRTFKSPVGMTPWKFRGENQRKGTSPGPP